ncbi:5-formyltetrahydrofolate cyclo-ligase [Hansschlegelia quercus]|uniref:5-formyltetrahydrofolate cyclo-ligase n=1 Tax=Hansschlegelia quercus TaxID=2528245 RepID=A0A4V2JDB5_9HYPH|nr:5-formyltetrahydrofolate cyclo-ligase [Hansschlegelia quercus]TBN47962.1 5-formyltetrahydrofolate cyclo-ligase [Hansschlegelia quercus]
MNQKTTASIDERKAALRAQALGARAALGADIRAAAAEAIATEGAALVAREKPACVSLFVSVRGEIDIGPLAAKLAEAGVSMCLPTIVQKGEPLVFRAWAPGDALEDRRFGLKEPPASAPEVTPDLLFVPLAAFDRAGGRIGYGGGFYDRTLQKLRATGPAMAIGLAFAAQALEDVPVEPHDEPLDGVLTENGVVTFG